MIDWYKKGRDHLLSCLSGLIQESENHTSQEMAQDIYSFLNDLGFIDYDVEKDIFYDWFGEEETGE